MNHLTAAPENSLANRKFKRAELQFPVSYASMHVCQPNVGSPRPGIGNVSRKTSLLCARKVSPNEARSFSPTFGKHELHVGITHSQRRVETNPVPLRPR